MVTIETINANHAAAVRLLVDQLDDDLKALVYEMDPNVMAGDIEAGAVQSLRNQRKIIELLSGNK